MLTNRDKTISNEYDHLTSHEIEKMFLMGLGDKYERAHDKHLSGCIRCRYLFINSRDSIKFEEELSDILRESPRKMSIIRNNIRNELLKKYQEVEVDTHPILNHVSDESYVKRIKSVDAKMKASLLTKVIAETSSEIDGELLIKTGEFNFNIYSELEKNYYTKQFIEQSFNNLTINFLGGPNISTHMKLNKINKENFQESNFVLELAVSHPDKVEINLKKENREKYHYIVHSKSNKIAFCDDSHKKFGERGTTIVFNDAEFCDYLRQDFYESLKQEDVTKWDLSFNSIIDRTEG